MSKNRTLMGVSLTLPTPVIVNGIPTMPQYWADNLADMTVTLKQSGTHIRVLPPPPVDTPGLPWPRQPAPPGTTRVRPDGLWSVHDLPNPNTYGGYYWLGTASSADGTAGITSSAQSWAASPATPGMPAWNSYFPFKPSVTSVDHYLQGGGVVSHPKGVNFNSHFIEHMWITLPGAGIKLPYTWIIAGLVASWPTDDYTHNLMDSGKNPGVSYSVYDVYTDRALSEHLGYRGLLSARKNHVQGASATQMIRARFNSAQKPTMFYMIHNGPHSQVGAWRHNHRATRNGHGGSGVSEYRKYFVLGRRNGILSQDFASHLLIFEVRLFLSALTQAELEYQYDLLAQDYKFADYD